MNRRAVGLLLALGAALAPSTATAHDAFGNAGAFWGGFLHPLTALEHVLAIVAFGLLAGLHQPRSAYAGLLGFALALAAGGIAGAAGLVPASTSLVASASITVTALLVALARPLPPPALIGLGLGLGALQGLGNGAAAPAGTDPIAFVVGVITGPTLVVHLVQGGVRSLEQPWMRIAVRVLGSWLAAVGLLVLGRFALSPDAGAG